MFNLQNETNVLKIWSIPRILINKGFLDSTVVAQIVKNSPAMWEPWVQSLGWEGPLEKGMATHSSLPAWRIPWTEEPCGQSMVSQRVGHN